MANINKNKLNRYDILTTTNESFELSFLFAESANSLIEDRNVFELNNTGLILKEFRKSSDLTLDFDGLSVTQGGTGLVPWDNTTVPITPPEAGFKADNRTASKPSYTFNSEDNTGIYLKGVNDLAFSVGSITRWAMNTTSLYPTTDLSLDIGTATERVKNTYTSRLLGLDGSSAQPTFSFIDDLDTGITRSEATGPIDQLNLVTAGATRLTIDSTGLILGVPLILPVGNEGAPSLTFVGDLDSGLYHAGVDDIRLTLNGSDAVQFDTTAVTINTSIRNADGSVGNPSYSFQSPNNDSGMYLAGTDDVRFAINGADRLQLTITNVIAKRQILGVIGSNVVPSYSFEGDTNTGFYSSIADEVRISTGGADKLLIDSAKITTKVRIQSVPGTLEFPSYSFEGDGNTGINNSGTDELSFITAQDAKLIIGTQDITARKPFLGVPGGTSAPSYSFETDSNTGMYRPSANAVGFTVNNLLAMTIDGDSAISSATTTVTIFGNLNVQGVTTTIDSTTVTITDNVILLNKDEPGPGVTLGTAGIEIDRGPITDNAGWFFNEAELWWGPTGPAGTFGPGLGVTQTIGNIEEIDTRDTTDEILYVDAKGIRTRGTDSGGTVTAPAYSFDANNNTGMWNAGTNDLRFSTAGSDKLLIDTTEIVTKLPIRGVTGNAGAPTFSFESDPGTGLYLDSAGVLGFSVSGTEQVILETTGITINGVVQSNSGSAGSPAYSFQGNTNTGMYRAAANDVRITSNAIDKISIHNTGIDIFDTTTITGDNGGGGGLVVGAPSGGALGEGIVNAEQISTPILRATGLASDVDLNIEAKGTGEIIMADVVRLPTYTVATAPTPTAGAIAYFSNGAAGNPVLAFGNGTNWLRSDTLATISV